MPDIVIEPMQPEDLSATALLLSRAMSVLPENRVVFRGRRDRVERLFRLMLNSPRGRMLLARDGDQVVGAMRMIEWPQCYEASLLRRIRMFPLLIRIMKGAFPRAMKRRSIWASHDPQKPHWHLGPLAVLPERQGQGIGSILLRHFCEHVDRLGTAGYLETGTSENVRLYERFGFSIIDEAPVFDVTTWFMWRPAAGVSAE